MARLSTILAAASGILATISGVLYAQTATPAAPTDTRSAMERAADKQRAAVAAMSESIARQKAAIQKRLPAGQADFFNLPRAVPMAPAFPRPASADCDALPAPVVDQILGAAATRENVDEQLLRSVIKTESAFNPCAVSPKGAMGLMQLMPATAEQYGVDDPFDPIENVAAGAKLLRELLGRYNGDLKMALGAYNAGPVAVDSVKGVPNIPETVDYLNTILNLLNSKH